MSLPQPFFSAPWLEGWRKPDPPGAAGRGGLRPPAELQAIAASNELTIVSTVTNGDCGLDSFWQSAARHQIRKEPWISMRKLDKVDAMLALRRLAADWIDQHKLSELWDEFTVSDLIRATCPDRTVQAYLSRMRKPGQWADTAFIHALACAFGVDVAVFQPQADVTLLGSSLMGNDTDTCVSMCLQNDFHFWAMLPADRDVIAWVNKGDPCRPATSESRSTMGTGDEDQAPEPSLALCEDRVQAELSLCSVLCKWDPWTLPSPAVIDAMQVLSMASAGDTIVPHSKIAEARRALICSDLLLICVSRSALIFSACLWSALL